LSLKDECNSFKSEGAVLKHGSVVIIITHVVPWPPAAGNEKRISRLVKWFRDNGFRVALLINHSLTQQQRNDVLQNVDFLHCMGDNSWPSWRVMPLAMLRNMVAKILNPKKRALQLRGGVSEDDPQIVKMMMNDGLIAHVERAMAYYRPKVVVAEYVGMSPCLDLSPPQALKIIDTHDVFSSRAEKACMPDSDDPFACTGEQERHCLLRADVVMAIQSGEAQVLQRLVPERQVISVGVDFAVAEFPSVGLHKSVLVTASDNPMNVRGIEDFLREAWPLIHARQPDAELRIAGRVCGKLSPQVAGVCKLGCLDDLGAEFERASLVVNPVDAGTGLKIKSIEALARGKCLVSMANGVEGIIWENAPPFIKCDTLNSMADSVSRLLSDVNARFSLATRARDFATEKYSARNVYRELSDCLCVRGFMK
jgi:hypothetical protein